ncbi:MAG: hypothetical protein ACYTFW_26175 [Planctomycetota bacterium]
MRISKCFNSGGHSPRYLEEPALGRGMGISFEFLVFGWGYPRPRAHVLDVEGQILRWAQDDRRGGGGRG